MSDQNQALADLARAVGDALQKFALVMEESSGLVRDPALDEHIELPAGRGQRQTQILELDGLSSDQGMKTAEIAAEINYEVPNTYSALQALERNGLVELLTGVTPQTWRLAPRYRNSAPVFKRIASRVQEGEWTTYGDISIAVRGDTKAARGVGRAARAVKDFPHPERVLNDGGMIHPNWKDAQGRGPDHCRCILTEQGVTFDEDGHASISQRVTWDELRRRDEAEPLHE